MAERQRFRIDIFSRGGNPKLPTERVFELPCPGMPANARFFGIFHTADGQTAQALVSLVHTVLQNHGDTRDGHTLQNGVEGYFEQLLVLLNRGYAELAQHGSISTDPPPDAIVGLLTGSDILLTSRGSVEAILLRPSEPGPPRRLVTQQETHKDPRMLFRTIMNGALRTGDTVLITRSELFDYLALHHATKLLTTLASQEARTRILDALTDVAPTVSLGGVVIGSMGEPEEKPQKTTSPATDHGFALSGRGVYVARRTVIPLLRAMPTVARRVWHSTRTAGAIVAAGTKSTTTFLRTPEKTTQLKTVLAQKNERMIRKWNALSRQQKLLSLAAIVVVVLFGEGIRFSIWNNHRQAQNAVYTAQVTAIEQKRDGVEASLIYQDEVQARTLLADARTLLTALPQNTNDQKAAAEKLQKELDALRAKVQHSISLADATTLFVPIASSSPRALGFYKNQLVLAQADGTILSLVKTTGAVSSTAHLALNAPVTGMITTAPTPLVRSDQSTLSLASSSTITNIHIPSGTPLAFTVWNSKGYALVPDQNQVMKGTVTDHTWQLVTPALKNASISDAKDFAIDSAIWIVGGTHIQKFLSGTKEDVAFGVADPPIASLTRVWTSADTSLLFLFDTPTNRVLIYHKDGQYVAEITDQRLATLHDILIDAKNKKFYLLLDDGLLALPLPANHQ